MGILNRIGHALRPSTIAKVAKNPNRLAKQLTSKKIGQTNRYLHHGLGRFIGTGVSQGMNAVSRGAHSLNIMNDKDYKTAKDFGNATGNVLQNAVSLPYDINHKGGLNAFTHNPSTFLVDKSLHDTSAYHNIVRPIAKTASNIGVGYLTGGLGGNAIGGAAAAGLGGALSGSLGSDPYTPVNNVVVPAVTGYAAGQAAGSDGGTTSSTIDNVLKYGGAALAAYPRPNGGNQPNQSPIAQLFNSGTGLNPAGGDMNQLLQRNVIDPSQGDVPQIQGLG